MPCNLSEIQSAACQSGIGKLQDPIKLLQLIAQLTCEASSGTAAYESAYVAILSQSGGDAPVPAVLQNTLSGTPVWARSAAGDYTMTLAGAFPQGKTSVTISPFKNFATNEWIQFSAQRESDDRIRVYSMNVSVDIGAGGLVDGLFSIDASTTIQIFVYP